MKKIILILICSVWITGLFAQEFEVPLNYELKKAVDYPKYEKDIINCVDWLMKTPVNSDSIKRQNAMKFLAKWMNGSPNVTIEINPGIVNFMEPNSDLLVIFMGCWTKYSLETQDFKNKHNSNLKGLEGVIAYYQKNKQYLEKDKNVEKYVKMKEKGTLEDYIKKQMQ